MIKKFLFLALSLILILALIGCGGGGSNNNSGPNPTNGPGNNTRVPEKIVITPGSASVIFNGGTRQFTAVCTDSNGNVINAALTWSVEPSNKGTISQEGLFAAGNEKGLCIVSCSYNGITASATVDITGLKDAGEQIVNDTQSVWGNLQTPIAGLNEILADTQTKFVTDLQYVNTPVSVFGRFITPTLVACLSSRLAPGGTYTIAQIFTGGPPAPPYQVGSWTVTDGDWTAQITRAINGSYDNITFVIINSQDTELSYDGSYAYLTSMLEQIYTYSINVCDIAVDIKFKDKNIDYSNGPATLKGAFLYNLTQQTAIFDGDLNFRFKDGERLTYTGDWKIVHNTTDKDYLKGTITTNNLTIDGEINIEYAENANMPSQYFNLFLKSLTLSGTVRNNDANPVILSGALNVAILNADSIDVTTPESTTNYLKGSVSFQGSIENGQNKIDAKVTFQHNDYQKYSFRVDYDLNNGGTRRKLDLTVSNPTAGNFNDNLHVAFNSDWGPASIVMDLTLAPNGSLTAISSGSLISNGQQVGTIELKDGLIRVNYNNGAFETF